MTADPRGIIMQQVFDRRDLVTQQIRDVGTEDKPGLRLIKLLEYNGQRTQTNSCEGDDKNSCQYAVSFQQDEFNRSIGKILDPQSLTGVGALNLQTILQHDDTGRVIAQTDAQQRTTWLFYDALGQKRFTIDAEGSLKEWQYDDAGHKHCVRQYTTALTVEELATLNSQTSLTDIVTLAASKATAQDTLSYLFYDTNGREQFRVRWFNNVLQNAQQGIVTETRYDGANHRSQIIGYAYTIDASHLPDLTTADITRMISTDPDNDRVTYYVVDASGQQRFTIDREGILHERRYDDLGRITIRIDYAKKVPSPQTLATQSESAVAEYVAQNIADPTQDQFTYALFNLFNKPDYTVKTTSSTTSSQQCAVSQYIYDQVGNLLTTCQFKQSLTFTSFTDLPTQLTSLIPDRNTDKITTNTVDACNRVTIVTDPVGNQDTYTQDALDNLQQHKDRKGNVWQLEYDRAKRLIKQTSPVVSVATVTQSNSKLICEEKTRVVTTMMVYDAVDNVIKKILDSDGDDPRTAMMEYNINNQLLSTTVTDVEVDDSTKPASLSERPTQKQTVSQRTIYNTSSKKIVEINEQEAPKFWVYDSLGRLTYEVNTLGSVKSYVRNSFGEVVLEAQYATPLTLDLNAYITDGLPLATVAASLTESDEDRYTYYDRDLSGNPVNIVRGIEKPTLPVSWSALQGRLFFYYPKPLSYGYGYEHTIREFNAFGQAVVVAKLVTTNPEIWASTYQWFDTPGNTIAVAEPVQESPSSPLTYRVARHFFNAFNLEEKTIKYAGYFSFNPDGLTVTQLDAYLATHTSLQDRVREKTYDQRGLVLTKSRVGVNREELLLDEKNNITFQPYNNITLTEKYTYDPTELKTSITHEALPDHTPTQEFYYYDDRGLLCAQTEVPFPGKDSKQTDQVITPLTYYVNNAHSQLVKKQAFINGAAAELSPDGLPQPQSADPTNDSVEIKQMDNRGKLMVAQDPNGYWELTTYTPTGQTARSYWQLTNYSSVVHIDEQRQQYDLNERLIRKELWRDNVSQLVTVFQYNAFGETSGEGPGDVSHSMTTRFAATKTVSVPCRIQIQVPRQHEEYKQQFSAWQKQHQAHEALFIYVPQQKCWRAAYAKDTGSDIEIIDIPVKSEFTVVLAKAKSLRACSEYSLHEQLQYLLQRQSLFKTYQSGLVSIDSETKEKKETKALDTGSTSELKTSLPQQPSQELKGNKDIKASIAAPFKASSTWPVYYIYDNAGRTINTNDQIRPGGDKRGLMTISLYDLTGAETATLVSPTWDLSVKSIADFPALLQASYTDIEKTQLNRDLSQRLLQQQLPDFAPGTASQPQYMPIELLASDLYPALGVTSLSWLAPTETSNQPKFNIYPAGDPGHKQELTIKLDSESGRYGVDVSALTTGTYDIEINYYLIDPVTGTVVTVVDGQSPILYYTKGRVYFVTTYNEQATEVIPTIKNDHVLWLAGAVSDVTGIALYNQDVFIKNYTLDTDPLTQQKYVDLGQEASGQYTVKPLTSDVAGASTPAFVINTDIPPVSTADPVSREIDYRAQVIFATDSTQEAKLHIWETLPLDFRALPVVFQGEYKGLDDKVYPYEQTTLSPAEDQTADLHFDNQPVVCSIQIASFFKIKHLD